MSAVRNKAAVSIHAQVFCEHVFVSPESAPGSAGAGHRVVACVWVFFRRLLTANLSPGVAVPFSYSHWWWASA